MKLNCLERSGFDVFNLGVGQGVTVFEVLEAFEEASRVPGEGGGMGGEISRPIRSISGQEDEVTSRVPGEGRGVENCSSISLTLLSLESKRSSRESFS